MINIAEIRNNPGAILAVGSYKQGYQAILDFDFLSGREPSIKGLVGGQKRYEKFFFGEGEVLIPYFKDFQTAYEKLGEVDWLFNATSSRRAYKVTRDFFETFPKARGAHLFAEDIPEIEAIKLYDEFTKDGKAIIGPAGVGLIVPGALKLGVIGGVDYHQIEKNYLYQPGETAVLSASGGMINEIISLVAAAGSGVSFGLCFGGDRFPATTPETAFLMAEADPQTKQIVYYGELGGVDEYEVARLIENGKITKPVIAYVAGVVGENFENPIQFGHAKALAISKDESASAKRQVLSQAGVKVALSIDEFSGLIKQLKPVIRQANGYSINLRSASLFTSTISQESAEGYRFIGRILPDWVEEGDIAKQIIAALLGKQPKSALTTDLVRDIFLLSVDHGPQVAGALNTIITARAGKGLVDSLVAGLLSVGPRFGGAVSDAASEWYEGVSSSWEAKGFVENRAKAGRFISGIGHKKYRLDNPDPRTKALLSYGEELIDHPYLDFAKAVESVTLQKNGNLILNVDGYIAALMLDVLEGEEKYSKSELRDLIEFDFFNALFVIPRTVGFIAHYLDQRRLDEGLFRLPDDDVFMVN